MTESKESGISSLLTICKYLTPSGSFKQAYLTLVLISRIYNCPDVCLSAWFLTCYSMVSELSTTNLPILSQRFPTSVHPRSFSWTWLPWCFCSTTYSSCDDTWLPWNTWTTKSKSTSQGQLCSTTSMKRSIWILNGLIHLNCQSTGSVLLYRIWETVNHNSLLHSFNDDT